MDLNSGSAGAKVLPGLTSAAVVRLGGLWEDRGLWDDVTLLAGRFWAADKEDLRLVCWHHLVMAVGNFKRQGGRRLRPAQLRGRVDQEEANRTAELQIPGLHCGELLRVSDPQSWRRLSGALSGAAVPTTTTILAALWPEQHFVFDWRVHAAANALRINAGLEATEDMKPSSTYSPPLRFRDYELVRAWLLEAAVQLKVSVGLVERSLYQLSREASTKNTSHENETWQSYASRVGRLLTAAPR